MFNATLTLTINSVDKVLNRINQDNKGSEYLFVSDVEKITMQIRHSVDKTSSGPVNRHNVYIERTIFATPVANRLLSSVTFTLRDSDGVGPTSLTHLSTGALALFGSLDQDLAAGVN